MDTFLGAFTASQAYVLCRRFRQSNCVHMLNYIKDSICLSAVITRCEAMLSLSCL